MKKRNELNIGILYISLWKQVKNRVGMDKVITRKVFFEILGKHYLIPKNLRDCVIKEMENIKLIQKTSRETIKILDCKYDLENNPNEFYRILKLY